jgi:hypothetical protein
MTAKATVKFKYAGFPGAEQYERIEKLGERSAKKEGVPSATIDVRADFEARTHRRLRRSMGRVAGGLTVRSCNARAFVFIGALFLACFRGVTPLAKAATRA